jgi:hypothetical protein
MLNIILETPVHLWKKKLVETAQLGGNYIGDSTQTNKNGIACHRSKILNYEETLYSRKDTELRYNDFDGYNQPSRKNGPSRDFGHF